MGCVEGCAGVGDAGGRGLAPPPAAAPAAAAPAAAAAASSSGSLAWARDRSSRMNL